MSPGPLPRFACGPGDEASTGPQLDGGIGYCTRNASEEDEFINSFQEGTC